MCIHELVHRFVVAVEHGLTAFVHGVDGAVEGIDARIVLFDGLVVLVYIGLGTLLLGYGIQYGLRFFEGFLFEEKVQQDGGTWCSASVSKKSSVSRVAWIREASPLKR
jgi:hypothetical protein